MRKVAVLLLLPIALALLTRAIVRPQFSPAGFIENGQAATPTPTNTPTATATPTFTS